METKIENNVKKIIINNIPLLAVLFLLLCSGVGNAILGCRCSNLSKSLGQYIQQFDIARQRAEEYEGQVIAARDTNTELRTTIGKAADTNRELGECLSRSTNTLSDLRSQLTEVRRRYQEMENILLDSRWNNSDTWNNYSSTDNSDSK